MKNETNKAKATRLARAFNDRATTRAKYYAKFADKLAKYFAKCDAAYAAYDARRAAAGRKYDAACALLDAARDTIHAAANHKIWNADITYDLAKAPHIAAFTATVAAARAKYDGATNAT